MACHGRALLAVQFSLLNCSLCVGNTKAGSRGLSSGMGGFVKFSWDLTSLKLRGTGPSSLQLCRTSAEITGRSFVWGGLVEAGS